MSSTLTENYSPPEVLLLLQVPLNNPWHMWLAATPAQKDHTVINENKNCLYKPSHLNMNQGK